MLHSSFVLYKYLIYKWYTTVNDYSNKNFSQEIFQESQTSFYIKKEKKSHDFFTSAFHSYKTMSE